MSLETVVRTRLRTLALVALWPLLIVLGACARSDGSEAPAAMQKPQPSDSAVAIFAGGCFWCMEPPYDKLPGVIETTSGYIGGHVADPSYEAVSAGGTGHAEAVKVTYDPDRIDYAKLLEVFWHNIDPVAVDRQFCDVGEQYRSAVFYVNEKQQQLALESKRRLAASGRFDEPIATEIVPATTFYPAEEYHQNYYKENPLRYKFYRYRCGRDARLEEIWGSPND